MNRYQRPLSQTQLREQNLSTILYCLKAEAPVSRAQLAKLTELNKSTVSSLTEELLSIGIIREVGQADSDGGRPATLLEIDADGGLIIGVDIGVHVVSAVLTNLSAQIVARFEQPTQTTDQTSPPTARRSGGAVRDAAELALLPLDAASQRPMNSAACDLLVAYRTCVPGAGGEHGVSNHPALGIR